MSSATSINPGPSVDNLRGSLQNGVWEGVVRIMGSSLFQGVFLAGFTAALGADALQMGIISAMGTLGMVSQVFSGHLLGAAGGRKRLFIAVNALGGLLWIALGVAAFFILPSTAVVWGFVAFCAVNSVLVATRFISWLDWLRTLVPPSLRGRYFGRRNRVMLIAGMALSVPMARWLDVYKDKHPDSPLPAYGMVFIVGGGLMLLSILFARRIEEAPMEAHGPGMLRTAARNAWMSGPFRRYFFFRFFMNFAMSLAGPLLVFYLISELDYSKAFLAGLGVVATVCGAVMLPLWGKLADRVGNRPAIMLVMLLKIVWAALWLFVGRDSAALLVIIYVLSSHGSASVLLHQNMQMKLVPEEGAASALGLFNVLTYSTHALAAVVGGLLIRKGLPPEAVLFGWTLTNWQLLILISVVLRVVFTFGLLWVHEPTSMPLHHFARLLWRGFQPEQPIRAGVPMEADADAD